jgi:hypothetical protein
MNLTTAIERVRGLLDDAGAPMVWTDAGITAAIRQAVGEYGFAGEAAVTLQGLDGAASTSLPAVHFAAVCWGSAGYAVLSRAIDQVDAFRLGAPSDDLRAWGEQRLREYKAMLGVVFPGYLVVIAAGSEGQDPAKTAAEVGLLGAQSLLTAAQAVNVEGIEARAAAAAAEVAAEKAAEAARLADLRSAGGDPWGQWKDKGGIEYPADYERS